MDRILFTDSHTGRTIVSQLDLEGACSLSEYTDNDGTSWSPSTGCGFPSGIDHQSVGGGPYALLPVPNPLYPDQTYYCSQAVADAFCARSDDGSATYNNSVAIYSDLQCGGLHGHIRVMPNGTAMVPNQNCARSLQPGILPLFPNQAAVVSTDDGVSWNVDTIPDSVSTLRSDPSVAGDSGNKVYFGYESGVYDNSGTQVGGRAMIATSTNNGTTWSPSVDVGAPFGIQNVTFPEVIAGDSGRAAYAFLGSTTGGDPESTTFPTSAVWELYVALTYDGGATWTVSDLTPGDPVQRACIFLAGTGNCPNPAKRNLYDFMDITVDSHGRVLVGYSDGCTDGSGGTGGAGGCDGNAGCTNAACSTGPGASTNHLASIARMTCGMGLIAQYDSALACSSVVTPEVPWVPAALLIGAGIAATGWRRLQLAHLVHSLRK